MKIFYAIQATGNGHISRAMELLPYLENYGKVDLFLSGANSSLKLDAPIAYRSNGLSLFYTCNGSLDYRAMVKKINPLSLYKEVNSLPIKQYDLVINDFEFITSQACKKWKIPSIQFGHQASFKSLNTPRPEERNRVAEFVLTRYATSTTYLGLHFEEYDSFIVNPVIKTQIREANPTQAGFVTVYLPSFCKNQLKSIFAPIDYCKFHIFVREVDSVVTEGNITFYPVNQQLFNESLIHCNAIVCGAGFETPAEAIYLKKKMMAIPIKGQYEQQCNAAALKKLGVTTYNTLPDDFGEKFKDWYYNAQPISLDYALTPEAIVAKMIGMAEKMSFSS